MFDITDPEHRPSLNEAIAWCARHNNFDRVLSSPELRDHFAQLRNAVHLFQRAKRRRRWFRWFAPDVTSSVEWRQGDQIIQSQHGRVKELSNRFRSPELQASPILDLASEQEWRTQLAVVVNRRRSLLPAQTVVPIDTTPQGRVLACVPSESVTDGASQYDSGGFFDEYDIPPCDTWIAYRDGTLYSWVPQQLVSLVQRGIDVNIVSCVGWED